MSMGRKRSMRCGSGDSTTAAQPVTLRSYGCIASSTRARGCNTTFSSACATTTGHPYVSYVLPRQGHSYVCDANVRMCGRYEMDCRADGKGANERLLFHGTDAPTTEAIDANGFNRSFSARAAFGNGVYFARDAIYSANKRYSPPDPANGLLQNLYLARVLVGWSQRGVPGLLSPDCREGNVRPYDSLVDRVDDPGVIVSCHNDNQAYPDYLLQIRSRAREPVARARAFIATFVRNDYHDEWGTPGRLDLSNLGLTDVDLERLVALEPVLTDGSCTILMLSGNTLTRVPRVLLHRRMESLTIPHSVQADCLPASASAWTGMINRQ